MRKTLEIKILRINKELKRVVAHCGDKYLLSQYFSCNDNFLNL